VRFLERSYVFAVVLGAALSVSYGPDCGHGFVKDDFRWVVESRARSAGDLVRPFLTDNGFYRPVVSLSFAANEWLFGTWAKGYALTNLGLLMLVGLALFLLCRALKLERGTALLAVGLWSMNPHGISGLVMWISGRTSGLVTLFALLAAWALVSDRRWVAAALSLLALLSKEEAFFLPFVLAAWAGWPSGARRLDLRLAVKRGWPVLLALVPYLALRAQTHAYLPLRAPASYRFTSDPGVLGRNLLEYADRSATLTLAMLVVTWLSVRRAPCLGADERRWLALGLIWAAGGFGLTLFVPSRSSLYVCLPLAGVAIAGAAAARSIWLQATPRARSGLLVAACLAPLALVPLHRSRNERSLAAAELSAGATAEIKDAWPAMQPGTTLVLEDDPARRPSLNEAFGSLLSDAIALTTGAATEVEYQPSAERWTQARVRLAGDAEAQRFLGLRLSGGHLEPWRP
jgi:hypothetical protein